MRAFLGIDPAMANTGLALWVEGDDTVSTYLIQESADAMGFQHVAEAGMRIASKVKGLVSMLDAKIDIDSVHIIMEYPPPTGNWAPGLFAVDALIYREIHEPLSPNRVYLAHPTKIDTLLVGPEPETPVPGMKRQVKFTKTERRKWVGKILDHNGLKVSIGARKPKKPLKSLKDGSPRKPKPPKTLTPDEGDAAMLLFYLVRNQTDRITLPEGLLPDRWEMKEDHV